MQKVFFSIVLLSVSSAIACLAPFGRVEAGDAEVEAQTRSAPLEVGDEAPDFVLPGADAKVVKLSSFRGKNTVVLYFYPKDGTPGCTKEAQDFRDDYEKFKKTGAVVLGVSVDDIASHKLFATKQNLNFPILADIGGTVARQYGVMGWIMAKRVTYVIDRSGKIQFVDANVDNHLPEQSKSLLKIVQSLGPAPAAKAKTKGKASVGKG